jgi:hypothetical protein
VALFCCRSKVTDIRDYAGVGTGNSNFDSSVASPLHAPHSGTVAVGGPNHAADDGREGIELTSVANPVMPRVFNGDYRQVPSETEDTFL